MAIGTPVALQLTPAITGVVQPWSYDGSVTRTARAFTDRLQDAGICISMDGRGRAFDNIIIERLWRVVEYEDLCVRNPETVAELLAGLARYWRFHNYERLH